MNGAHQQKNALNKHKRFVINQKTISTSQNERLVEKCDLSGPKIIFDKCPNIDQYCSPSNGNNGFKENMNKRVSLSLIGKSVATNGSKGFV